MSSRAVVPFSPARWRGPVAAIAIAATAACDLVLSIARVGDLAALSRAGEVGHLAEVALPSHRTGPVLVEIASLAFLLTAAVFFLAWFHRVHRNLRALGATDLRYSPGWAVGGFFVPILNLWRPLTVMSEIREHSDPRAGVAGAGERGDALQGFWWVAMLATRAFQQRIERVGFEVDPSVDAFTTATALSLPAGLTSVVAAGCVIALIREIDRNQLLRHREQLRRAQSEGVAAPGTLCESCGGERPADTSRCRFCGSRPAGTAVGCATVAGWGTGFGVVSMGLLASVGLGYLELDGGLTPVARPGQLVDPERRAQLHALGILEPDEELVWLDVSSGPFEDGDFGDALTDRRALSYHIPDSDADYEWSWLSYEEIRGIEVVWTDESDDYTQIAIDFELLDEPPQGDENADGGDEPFYLHVSPNLGGDHGFVDALLERLPPGTPVRGLDEPADGSSP